MFQIPWALDGGWRDIMNYPPGLRLERDHQSSPCMEAGLGTKDSSTPSTLGKF